MWQVLQLDLTIPVLHITFNHMLSQLVLSPSRTRFFAVLDIHRDTILSCVHDTDLRRSCDERRDSAQKPKSLIRFVESKQSKYGDLRRCNDASFCGTALCEPLTALDVDCAIIAPGSIP